MPAGDGTGPMGMGPMTGRGAGYCAGFAFPGFANPAFGRGLGMGFGWGRGRGRGRGWRHQFYATGLPFWARTPTIDAAAPPDDEPMVQQQVQALKARAAFLEKSLEQIRRRIAELETAPAKES